MGSVSCETERAAGFLDNRSFVSGTKAASAWDGCATHMSLQRVESTWISKSCGRACLVMEECDEVDNICRGESFAG